jgi:hypothetical protein
MPMNAYKYHAAARFPKIFEYPLAALQELIDDHGLGDDVEEMVLASLNDVRGRFHAKVATILAVDKCGSPTLAAEVFGVTRTAIYHRLESETIPLQDYLAVREDYPDAWENLNVEWRAYDEGIRVAMLLVRAQIYQRGDKRLEEGHGTLSREELECVADALASQQWADACRDSVLNQLEMEILSRLG